MDWVRGCGVDGVQRDQEENDEKWQEPCVSQTGIGEPVEEGAGATPFGMGLGGLFMCAIKLLVGSRVSNGDWNPQDDNFQCVPSDLVRLVRSGSLHSLWTWLVHWCHL